MTKISNAIKLLGILAILIALPVSQQAFAATATVSSARVISSTQVQIVFSDPLDFVAGDFTDLNIDGSARTIDSVSAAPSATVTITFSGGPAVTTASTGDIDIAAIADGGSGNDFPGATNQALTDGQSPPAPVLALVGTSPTNDNPVGFTVNFGEDINAASFTSGDVTVSSGTVQNIADSGDGQNFTFEVASPTNGATLSVQITGNIDDLAGNTVSTDSNTVNVDIDYTAPTVTLSSTATSPTNTSPIPMTAQFSETVTGFLVGDIVVGNGVAGNFVAVDGDTYTFDVTPTVNGLVTVDVAGSVAQDNAGNNNSAATQFVITFDSGSPTVVLSTTATNPTGTSPIPMTAQFSETVTGFLVGDIVVGNGVAGNFVAVDGDTYTFDVTPTVNGLVTVDVAAGVAQDAALNGNLAATQFTITYDTAAPVLTLTPSDTTYNVAYGSAFTNPTATCIDALDGDISGSVIITGTIDTTIPGSQTLTYSCTDSNANTVSIIVTVTVAGPSTGDSCAGDCYRPHLGNDQASKNFYDDGLRVNGIVYPVLNVLHNHPEKLMEMPVGSLAVIVAKAQDSYPDNIERCELSIGIPKGNFDKSLAAFKIGINRSFDGTVTPYYEGDLEAFRQPSVSMKNEGQNVMCTWSFIPTKHLQHDMFAVELMDIHRYTGTYYFNEGITFKGLSEVGTPVFDYMDNRGRIHTLTIVDQTLEDLSIAIDEQGNTWNLDAKTTMWAKQFVRPDMTGSISPFSGADRDDYNEFMTYKEGQAMLATQKFDSSKIQGKLEPSKTIEYPDRLPRGTHALKSNDNICDEVKEFLSNNPKVVNHSSCKLD